MEKSATNSEVRPLTELDIPDLSTVQLEKFTLESLHVEKIAAFNPATALDILQQKEGAQVLGADFGGDKGMVRLFRIEDGQLVLDESYAGDIQGNLGEGYLATLQTATAYAEAHEIPLGISWGGPLDGTKMEYHPKLSAFFDDLEAQYGGDFQSISPSIKAIYNDGPAGLVSGAVESYRTFQATSVLFVINGGGLGLGVLKGNTLYSTEAGHVEGVVALNTYDQSEPCGVFGARYTCLERLGANKVGIESQWFAATGEYMRARDIEDRYKAGDRLAGALNDHSALVVANMIQGTANALKIQLGDATSAIVGHGGAFKFPNYGKRVQQILAKSIGTNPHLLMTKDFTEGSSNACLDGAAIAALTNSQ